MRFYLAAAIIATLTLGCEFFQSAKGPTCQVVDALHEACILVKYQGVDGKEQTIKMSSSDVARGALGVAALQGGVVESKPCR